MPINSSRIAPLALLLISVFVLTGCPDSKTEVHRVGVSMPPGQKQMKGVFYALPRTLVLVKVPITRTDKLPGKYEKFARCFFPDEADRRVKNPSTEFEVSDEITFESKGEPDPNQIFMVNTKAGWFQTKSLMMAYTDDGVLSSAKAETKDESIDFAISTFKTLASIGGAIATQGVGSTAFGTNIRAFRPADRKLTPTEYEKEAKALKARAQARKCYNFYVTATASKARVAADLLQQSLAALEKAGGSHLNYSDDDLKVAEKEAKEATIENGRAAELAAQAIDEPPALQTSEGSGDTTKNTFSGIVDPNQPLQTRKPRRVRGRKGRRTFSGIKVDVKDGDAKQTPYDPLEDGERHEKNAVNKAREVVGEADTEGLSEQARKHAKDVYEEATRAFGSLPASSEKDIAKALLESTAKALKGTTAAIREAQELAQGSSGSEFGDTFRSGYYEALPFAERIFSLQKQREEILTTNPGEMRKETLELMLKEIDATIKTYKQVYFVGAKKSDTWAATFEYLPPSADHRSASKADPCIRSDRDRNPSKCTIEESVSLFDFSEAGGVCGGGVLASQGIKVKPDFQIPTKCSEHDPVFLSLEKLKDAEGRDDQFAAVVKDAKFQDGYGLSTREQRGFYYRIPARARFRVSVGTYTDPDKEVKRTILPIAQLGVIASLPVSSGGRRTSYNITLDAATGALRNFELGADAAIQKSMLDDAQTGVKSIIDAKDPLARLKRRKEFLETLKGMQDAEKALKNTNENNNGNTNSNPNP